MRPGLGTGRGGQPDRAPDPGWPWGGHPTPQAESPDWANWCEPEVGASGVGGGGASEEGEGEAGGCRGGGVPRAAEGRAVMLCVCRFLAGYSSRSSRRARYVRCKRRRRAAGRRWGPPPAPQPASPAKRPPPPSPSHPATVNVTSDATAMTNRGGAGGPANRCLPPCLPTRPEQLGLRSPGRRRQSRGTGLFLPSHTPPARASLPVPQQTALKNVIKVVVAFISKDLQN